MYRPKAFEMGLQDTALRAALVAMRSQLATEKLGRRSFLSPQSLMSTQLLDRIVGLAHEHRISTLPALQEQITWAHLESYGNKIISLVNQFHPTPSPFTTQPLQHLAITSSGIEASDHPRKQVKCSNCGTAGHNSTYIS